MVESKNKTKTKQLPFECGSNPVGDTRKTRFSVSFYLIAVLFILFDVEIVFMYPWAVNILELGWQGLFAIVSFMSVFVLALVYVWKKGILNWK